MIDLEIAYCAGVVDSDGTIGIKRSTYSMRVVADCGGPTYSERICVKQVEFAAIETLHRLFGGSLYIQDPNAQRGRSLYTWQVTDKKAASALTCLLPHLRIKRAQALNALELRAAKGESVKLRKVAAAGKGTIGGAPRDSAISALMQSLYERSKELNSVGR